ncbi:DUF6366 family protein [Peribacillus frigoritolerans]|uniref:DUF6366 family protein n=1 Tax=Peribacillus frigoritolerans TaxID=450367 RepID=UPI0010592D29|nr:DUF6366 family protein [Peribacillus frigoritolerans]TDL76160.1 hypothetical protein E2R53_20930 [Peribacillus frigoritolerans]
MIEEKQTPEIRREKLRQEELKRNSSGYVKDAFNRDETGNLTDLVGSLGWKGTGILILIMIKGLIIAAIFLK